MSATDSPRAVARRTLAPFLRRLTDKPETIAVVILSNAAGAADRLPFDERSDFDIALVLDAPLAAHEWRPIPAETYRLIEARLPTWVPSFSFHVPVPWGRMEVNVNQVLYQYEADPRTEWSDSKCEAYAGTGEIMFDRDGVFAQLVEAKAAERSATSSARLVRLANRLSWDIAVLPRRQRDRGEVFAAHLVVNLALDELMEAIFLLNDRFVPNRKWRFYLIRKHRLLTAEQEQRLEGALRCDTTSPDDLERRIHALDDLWRSLRERSTSIPQQPYKTFAATRLQLLRSTVADACEARFSRDAYDIANYLLLASPDALTSQDPSEIEELPGAWVDQVMSWRSP